MKTYLIIGGNSGIGLETGKKLLNAGHQVIQWAREEGELSQQGSSYHPYQLMGASPPLPDSLDGLVYAPGSIHLKPFHQIKKEEFLEDFKINTLGAIEVLQKLFLKFNERASVVLFSSVAVQTGMPYHSAVGISKGAIEGLVRALAAEWAPKIRVNAIAPSLTDTPLAEKFLNTELKREAMVNRHPLKKVGSAVEVASLVEFLLSAESGFLTGQILTVDGGIGSLRV